MAAQIPQLSPPQPLQENLKALLTQIDCSLGAKSCSTTAATLVDGHINAQVMTLWKQFYHPQLCQQQFRNEEVELLQWVLAFLAELSQYIEQPTSSSVEQQIDVNNIPLNFSDVVQQINGDIENCLKQLLNLPVFLQQNENAAAPPIDQHQQQLEEILVKLFPITEDIQRPLSISFWDQGTHNKIRRGVSSFAQRRTINSSSYPVPIDYIDAIQPRVSDLIQGGYFSSYNDEIPANIGCVCDKKVHEGFRLHNLSRGNENCYPIAFLKRSARVEQWKILCTKINNHNNHRFPVSNSTSPENSRPKTKPTQKRKKNPSSKESNKEMQPHLKRQNTNNQVNAILNSTTFPTVQNLSQEVPSIQTNSQQIHTLQANDSLEQFSSIILCSICNNPNIAIESFFNHFQSHYPSEDQTKAAISYIQTTPIIAPDIKNLLIQLLSELFK